VPAGTPNVPGRETRPPVSKEDRTVSTTPNTLQRDTAQAPDDPRALSTLSPPLARLAGQIIDRTATVAVVGLGYVGLPLLQAAGAEGFGLIGLDTDATKIERLLAGRSHIVDVADDDLALTRSAQFTTEPAALGAADVILVAVPTPLRDGTPDLSLVRAAVEQIVVALRPGQLIILESTTYPGTTEELVRPILESSGLRAGEDIAVAYSPERINPGDRRSFRATPKIVAGVGTTDTNLAELFYGTLVDTVVRTSSPRQAEMAKLIENTFRQVNIALVNELATVASGIGVDIWEALDAAATKPFGYMPFWPGSGVGGHCIAIDPSYLSWKVEQRLGFGVGFIEHARTVNNRMPAHVANRVSEALNGVGKALRGARLVVLGLTYKPGVNDVRESPAVNVLQRLIAGGARCAYHDPYVPSVVIAGRRHGDFLPVPPEIDTEELPRLESTPLSSSLLAAADCVVILTAHEGIDYDAVVDGSPLVFDTTGVTRHRRLPHVVLL
jgi:UDP-N-acetyl-D-glucosamine dehydrogenase